MKEWEVKIYETFVHSTTVEAANEQEAYEKAHEIITTGKRDEYGLLYETEAVGFNGMWDAYEC
jgi:hypothetical protein